MFTRRFLDADGVGFNIAPLLVQREPFRGQRRHALLLRERTAVGRQVAQRPRQI